MAVIVSKELKVPVLWKLLSDYAVGESVFLNVNGSPCEFLIVNQGLPPDPSQYDSSCDGTWLLMKNCYIASQWHNSNNNNYRTSSIHSYLNGTFFNLFDSGVQSTIKQVKIPYVNGTSESSSTVVATGANGLSAKVFLLTNRETGGTNSYKVGTALSYFEGCGNDAHSKRVATLNGSAVTWWLRDIPAYYDTYYAAITVDYGGRINSTYLLMGSSMIVTSGVRPALIMPKNSLFNPDTNQFLKGVK